MPVWFADGLTARRQRGNLNHSNILHQTVCHLQTASFRRRNL
ncbi:hypothetical protein [Neisseria animalis]|nr:hypothetical protein [Neisseria animalis]